MQKSQSLRNIDILMVGGCRPGKSSMLASMDMCCMTQLAGFPQISIIRDADSGAGLAMKRKELRQYFTKKYTQNPFFIPDLQPMMRNASYGFEIGVNDKNLGCNLRFTDIPGEWMNNPEYFPKLQDAVNQSRVIIIAIDTPHLVEEVDPALGYGRYHDTFNRVPELTRFFKTTFQNCKEHRLVIFVPLKCEKYYYQNDTSPDKMGMPMVNAMVKKGYKELLDFLTSSDIGQLSTIAIMPVLTLGGAEFFMFDEDGYSSLYSYVQDPALRKFAPKYCEQPMFLTLKYVIELARVRNARYKIPACVNQIFHKQDRFTQLISCENMLKGLIQTDKALGFEILNNPLNLMI